MYDYHPPMQALWNVYDGISSSAGVVAVAWEREDGRVFRYDFPVPRRLDPAAARLVSRVAERVAKFALWAAGGWRLYLSGPDEVVKPVARAYAKKGARAFDVSFFSSLYGRPVETVVVPYAKMPDFAERTSPALTSADGCRLGFDLGASDFKVSALRDGEVVFSKEFPWNPRVRSNPAYHYAALSAGLKEAAAALPRVDAIGGSTAGVLVGGRIGVSSIFRAVAERNPARFDEARDIFLRLEREWGVPVRVMNDGDVTALAGALAMKRKGVLGVAMGSSEAVGFVDPRGATTGRISELAFAPVDMNPAAPRDEWSGDAGVGAMYFSQQAVDWLARGFGFAFPKSMKLPERLKTVQAAMEKGDARALKVYVQVGRFLGHAIPWYREFYDFSNLMVLGRVASGLGGEIVVETARTVLRDVYPEWAEKIDVFMPDERARRLGQSVVAAQLPPAGRAG